MRENRDYVVPVNILTSIARAPFSWATRHTTVYLDLYCSHSPFQKAPHPSAPDALVKSCISELGVQSVSQIKEEPDQFGR